ncbi:hypothetical protein BLA29_012204 [Euroglyphus maynei]|uniref:Uncharacterized protein n=1 Tax=Euroglyphus maynei TaxID=6958 RepID=A0A1Y3BUW6_EURMA|nr:hypothetical protein BLA29_012204 [Euroglyphus maynei]
MVTLANCLSNHDGSEDVHPVNDVMNDDDVDIIIVVIISNYRIICSGHIAITTIKTSIRCTIDIHFGT